MMKPEEIRVAFFDFLHEFAEALERHYGAQLKRHYDALASAQRDVDIDPADPPF